MLRGSKAASTGAVLVLSGDGRIRQASDAFTQLVEQPLRVLRGSLPPYVFWLPGAFADWQRHWSAWQPDLPCEVTDRWCRADGVELEVRLHVGRLERRWPASPSRTVTVLVARRVGRTRQEREVSRPSW